MAARVPVTKASMRVLACHTILRPGFRLPQQKLMHDTQQC